VRRDGVGRDGVGRDGRASLVTSGPTADPFVVLGIASSATLDEVRAARRRLALDRHPDRGGDPAAMRELNAAFDAAVKAILQPPASRPSATYEGTPPAPRPVPEDQPLPPRQARRLVEHDMPSFTIDVLPVEAFEALLVVASWIGEVLVDDPPYLLDVHLTDPGACWCRLELLPEAGGTTVNLTVASVGQSLAPSVETVRDVWIDQLNAL
jgi:hypothetical protein